MGKLKKTEAYRGQIELVSGLMIGGSDSDIRIGGLDKEVIKHPISEEPVIPGSSLKGKIRSLLESKYGRMGPDGGKFREEEPCQCGKCNICRLFGAHKNTRSSVAPPRLLFRDCMISEESKEYIKNQPIEKRSFYETKAENSINRVSGTASNPRFMERVIPGMRFNFEVVLQEYDTDNVGELKRLVEEGIRMLEKSYLGARGSAGNGQIKFVDCKWVEV